MGALSLGFGRRHVSGRGAAWLIETAAATAAERMCALPPDEAARWVALAQIEMSPQVEEGVRDRDVLVMVERGGLPSFDVSPSAIDLVDLLPRGEASGHEIDEADQTETDFIEIQVVDARGRPRPSVRYILQLPDGGELQGTTDADGMLRAERLTCSGDAVLRLPDVEAA